MTVVVILTCYNRAEKTKKCLETLISGNPKLGLEFIVVNDGSTDSTKEELHKIDEQYHNVTVVETEGNLFYSKGMRRGMDRLNESGKRFDYVLLVNDDVEFAKGAVQQLIDESSAKDNAIIVGATCDDCGEFTYGGVRKKEPSVGVEYISNKHSDERCDSFNANCVLIPWKDYANCEPMDDYYSHTFGDFDYGFALLRNGGRIYTSSFFAGTCNRNPKSGTWNDTTLPRRERIKKKESAKGLPFKSYFHYLHKNYGLGKAIIFSMTPYIRIMLGK